METWRKELYLAHHGILGQKWGKKMGPPYPLDGGDHSASEKKAGWRESLDERKRDKQQRKESKLIDKVSKKYGRTTGGETLNRYSKKSKTIKKRSKELNDIAERAKDLDLGLEDLTPGTKEYKRVKSQRDKAIREYKQRCAKITDDIIGKYGDRQIGNLKANKQTYREMVYESLTKPHAMWMLTSDEKKGRKKTKGSMTGKDYALWAMGK